MAHMTPTEAASALLLDHDGDQRAAEADAWKRRDQFRKEEAGYDYWLSVALVIVDGKEFPKVDRKANVVPAPAFKATGE